MKKGVLILVLFSLFLISFVNSDASSDAGDDGYDCLKQEFNDLGGCDGLADFEEQVFALMTLGECSDEILADDTDYLADLRLTALAALALEKVGLDSTEATDWLAGQEQISQEMNNWYLQIDSTVVTQCEITYSGSTDIIDVAVDKTISISTDVGGCFDVNTAGYWLVISKSCYGSEFEIKCNEAFKTNLLFDDDSTTYVSPDTSTKSANEISTEQINFKCFKDGSDDCDYEGTLWATYALEDIGSDYDTSAMEFYLTTLYKDYSNLIPEVFLYGITGQSNYLGEIPNQINDEFWRADTYNNKYYDTALVLSFLRNEFATLSNNAENWLIEEQAESGCWNTGQDSLFRDTAFILDSNWLKSTVRVYPDCRSDDDCRVGEVCNPEDICETACDINSDCLTNEYCSDTTQTCIFGCDSDDDSNCAAGEFCSNHLCKECEGEDECTETQYCDRISESDTIWTCQPDCSSDDDCTSGSKNICDNSICKECATNLNCASGEYCSDDTWTCETGCADDSGCASGETCIDAQCKECVTDLDCTVSGETCNVNTWTCESDCSISGSECNEDEFCDNSICIECNENNPCGSGYNCVDAVCILNPAILDGDDEVESCVDLGYFCMGGTNCKGSILDSYECTGFDKCCSQEQILETCNDLNGDICNSDQKCEGGSSENTFDLSYGQKCCVGGACEDKGSTVEDFTCERNGGTCRIEECETGEEKSYDTCEFNDNCCIKKETTAESNYQWVWVLGILILILLVGIGIVKRDKLREFWFRLKSKIKKRPPQSPGRGRPLGRPTSPAASQRRLMQGRPSPSRRPPMRRPSRVARPSSKAPSEINDVLKKLKDMGK